MATTMHRLQISLPEWQVEYLKQRAERDGVSIAEVIRRLVRRETESVAEETGVQSLWKIAGIGEDRQPLVRGVPVSESPELYVTEGSRQDPDESPESEADVETGDEKRVRS